MNNSALFVFKQWTKVFEKSNPTVADGSTTGFCKLPISIDGSYSCYVHGNYYNHWWMKDSMSTAALEKRYVNFIVDTQGERMYYLNGFKYALNFSPIISTIGLSYYALIVCIKEGRNV